LKIRLHPELREILHYWPRVHIAILTTIFGKPFTVAGFGNMMADAIKAAGVPEHCVPHVLRKTSARRLAEIGCSEKQIAAVTGHTTLKEIARLHTRGKSGASCRRCNQYAGRTKDVQKFPTLIRWVGKSGKITSQIKGDLWRCCPGVESNARER
jgi:Phage integrase family